MRPNIFLLPLLFLSVFLNAQEVQWKSFAAEGEPLARHENALVAVGDKIILIGGRGEKPLDIYDTAEKTWSRGAQPPFEMHHMQAVSFDGLVYVLGGFTGSWPYETPLSHVLIYDIHTDAWTIGAEIPHGRRRGAAGVVAHNNKIYIINGIINGHTSGWVNWLDEYDPYSNTWKILPNSPVARDHFQAAIIDDQLYVAGGRRSGSAESGFAGTVKETNVYNFKTASWETLADIPTPRAGTAAAVYKGNYVVIGGESDVQEKAHNEVEIFDPVTKAWKKLPPLKAGRHGTQAISFEDNIIIGAGSGNRGGGPELTSFEFLSASEDSEVKLQELKPCNLTTSVDSIFFDKKSSSRELTLHNSGESALVISYLQLDDTKNFGMNSSAESPIILEPGKNLTITFNYTGKEENSSAKLLIKTLGNLKPLVVELSR